MICNLYDDDSDDVDDHDRDDDNNDDVDDHDRDVDDDDAVCFLL